MTESEWLTGEDLRRMLKFVRPRFTAHKALAFASACDHLLTNPANSHIRQTATAEADDFVDTGPVAEEWEAASLIDSFLDEAVRTAFPLRHGEGRTLTDQQRADRVRTSCSLLRDLFNPFQSVSLDPGWRTRTVIYLARGLYDARDSEHLPILADALEDAGCTDAAVLDHLRGPGPHVRGCWAVDLLLGRS